MTPVERDSEKKRDLDKKRIILSSIFLAIFIFGTICIFITPSNIEIKYNLTVETKDGEQISFNTYEPIDRHNDKMTAIIIGHGVMVNKEMLKSYAIELATSGFFVVTHDFRGHGLSSGEIERNKLKNDVKAIKAYLLDKGSIDRHNFGYIGYSMGGFAGNDVVKDDNDFKFFIGVGTGLALDYEDCKNRDLNILMILAKYDQGRRLEKSKEEIADRLNIDDDDVQVNKLYESFKTRNATKLFYDDNSDHFTTAYDQDFVREARDWAINTFPKVKPIDSNFYANFRFLILIMQLIGGIGFFFLIIKPLAKLIVKPKEEEEEVFEIKTDDETIETLSLKALLYSFVLAIPGMAIIFFTVFLFLPLTTAGLSTAVLFGQAFGILILLWRIGKKNDLSIKQILLKPVRGKRGEVLREIALGAILASILYTILYLSIGLNYLGIIPSLNKIPWVLIYMALGFFMLLIFSIFFQVVIQAKFEKGMKNLFKAALLQYSILMVYFISFIMIFCILMGTMFYNMFFYFAIPMFLLAVFISALLYQHTGKILAGAIVNSVFILLIICTLSPLSFGLAIPGFS